MVKWLGHIPQSYFLCVPFKNSYLSWYGYGITSNTGRALIFIVSIFDKIWHDAYLWLIATSASTKYSLNQGSWIRQPFGVRVQNVTSEDSQTALFCLWHFPLEKIRPNIYCCVSVGFSACCEMLWEVRWIFLFLFLFHLRLCPSLYE